MYFFIKAFVRVFLGQQNTDLEHAILELIIKEIQKIAKETLEKE